MFSDLTIEEQSRLLEGLPWFELGQSVGTASTIAEALSLADLDYRVEKRPISYPIVGEDGSVIEHARVPDFYVTVNTKTNGILGVVGKRFRIRQNYQAFAALEPLVEGKILKPDIAGSLGENNQVTWIMAELGHPYEVTTDDLVAMYVLMVNSHGDGERNLALKFIATPIRLVSGNTNWGSDIFGLRHTQAVEYRMTTAGTLMHMSMQCHQEFRDIAERLVNKKLTRTKVYGLLAEIFPELEETEPGERPRIEKASAKIIELLDAEEVPKARGTAWSLYNAVTNFVDRFRATRGFSHSNRLHNRLKSMWFGPGARVKDRALNYILKNFK